MLIRYPSNKGLTKSLLISISNKTIEKKTIIHGCVDIFDYNIHRLGRRGALARAREY